MGSIVAGLARIALLAVAVLLVSACTGEELERPAALLDGSPVVEMPVELEGIDVPTVLTKVEIDTGSEQRESCLREWKDQASATIAVTRVGVQAESVTFRDPSGRSVFGCDNGAGPREDDRRWCGGSYGRLHDGRLLDPRLDILCATADAPMAFAWVEPAPSTRFVVVHQDGYAEVYERAASLPVRIASTTDVDLESASASFSVTEHDDAGALIRSYALEARVAG
ncbi:MAG: hypothetical protein R6W48_04590 [Gaiellaceae bacterium]